MPDGGGAWRWVVYSQFPRGTYLFAETPDLFYSLCLCGGREHQDVGDLLHVDVGYGEASEVVGAGVIHSEVTGVG